MQRPSTASHPANTAAPPKTCSCHQAKPLRQNGSPDACPWNISVNITRPMKSHQNGQETVTIKTGSPPPRSERMSEIRQLRTQSRSLIGRRLTFVSTSSFGRAGRAAMKAIYARQHADCAQENHLMLTQRLRALLRALCSLLKSEVPREISLTHDYKVKSIV